MGNAEESQWIKKDIQRTCSADEDLQMCWIAGKKDRCFVMMMLIKDTESSIILGVITYMNV